MSMLSEEERRRLEAESHEEFVRAPGTFGAFMAYPVIGGLMIWTFLNYLGYI
jgi:hypothetical protein